MKSEAERLALKGLAIAREDHGVDCCVIPFKGVARRGGLELPRVRRAVRALARKGLAEFHKGLFNDDGEVAGAGYCITDAGWKLYKKIGSKGAADAVSE